MCKKVVESRWVSLGPVDSRHMSVPGLFHRLNTDQRDRKRRDRNDWALLGQLLGHDNSVR